VRLRQQGALIMNHTLPGPVVDQETAYLFVDLSNLWYGLRADAVRHGDPEWAVRIHAGNLRRILAAGRAVGEAILVANTASYLVGRFLWPGVF
jgi:hypothetical protein